MNPPPAGIGEFQNLIIRLINISVGLAFVILTVVLVWAGIKYITSGGDTKSLQTARDTITWGLLGILFLVLGWLILKLIEAFTGVPVSSQFCIGFSNSVNGCF